MNTSKARFLWLKKLAVLVPSSALLLSLSAPVASAEVVDPQLSLAELGISDSIAFPGNLAEIPISVDVPQGTTPSLLEGTLQVPAEFSGGVVELYQNNRLIQTTPIEVTDGRAPLALPLDGLEIEQGIEKGKANFSLRTVLTTVNDYWCIDDPEARLIDGRVQFSGTIPNPSVVADFFPQILKTLSIYVPEHPSEAVQESAFEIATAIDAVYPAFDVDINVETLPDGASSPTQAPSEFERQIVLTDSSDSASGTTLVNPGQDDFYLHLSGDADILYDQSRLLTDSLLQLAVDTEATASGMVDAPNMSTEVATLQDLGITTLTSESVARTIVRVGIDRSKLRTFSGEVEMHLTGTYTPLPVQNSGQITFSVGDRILDSFVPDASGTFDRQFTIPGELLDRYTEVVVEYRSTGEVHCATTQPIGLTVDPDSVVNSKHSNVPVLSGFQTLPQGFQPSVDVALSQGDAADLSRAVSLLVGIQSLSSQRIRPHLVSWDEALTSERPTIFVDATGENLDQVPSYVAQHENTLEITNEDNRTEENEAITKSLEINSKFVAGVIQAVWDREQNRVVVVASSSQSPEELDSLISWLDEDHGRWGQLNGDLVVKTQDRDPIELSTVDSVEQQQNSISYIILVALGVLTVIIIVAVSIFVTTRTKRSPR